VGHHTTRTRKFARFTLAFVLLDEESMAADVSEGAD
jgi:hypothetical protein